MKILHLNYSDISGGAARGAYWLHNALIQSGVDSKMLVAHKLTQDKTVIQLDKWNRNLVYFRSKLDQKSILLYKGKNSSFFSSFSPSYSPFWLPDTIVSQVETLQPDLLNLHWIYSGFLSPESIRRFKKPIIWTLRDMWAFTGGCAYTRNCDRYTQFCGSCPQLDSKSENDVTRKLWERKQKSWSRLNLNIVSISHWLADCARKSSLLKDCRITVIPNAIDVLKFKPMPKETARKALGFSSERKIILFGAIYATNDERKGFKYVVEAIKNISKSNLRDVCELVVFGFSKTDNPIDVGIPVRYLGMINDDQTLVNLYSASDVMLVPSIQEAFGKTALEAIACGTPVVSFDSSGLKDIIEHKKNGYRAECFSAKDLARGIAWILEDEERYQRLSQRAREKTEKEFTMDLQAKRYLTLYSEVLEEYRKSLT